MKIEQPGKYVTRDGRIAEVTRVGQFVANGTVGSRLEVWDVSNGSWYLNGQEHRWDLVDMVREPEVVTDLVSRTAADMTEETCRKIVLDVANAAARVEDLRKEAVANRKLISALITIDTLGCCQPHKMENVFMLGLRVGMEMERSETGGVKLD